MNDILEVAKRVADGERVAGADKKMFFAELQKRAEELRKASQTMTKEAAFARVYSDPVNRTLAVAHKRAPGGDCDDAPVATTKVAEAAAVAGHAYQALVAKGAEVRKQRPELSKAQAFVAALTDPANRLLALREQAERRARSG